MLQLLRLNPLIFTISNVTHTTNIPIIATLNNVTPSNNAPNNDNLLY